MQDHERIEELLAGHAIRALSEAKYGWGQGLVIELDPGGKTHRLGNPIGLITFRREGSKQC